MLTPQSFEVFCPNIRCGYERLSSAGWIPIRTRQHRRMSYVGSRKVGLVSLTFRSLFTPDSIIEMGTYHFYSCPVCGQEATYLQKWGMMHRVE